jgi:hypothetical protein
MPAAKAAQLARLNRQGDAGKGGGSQSFERIDINAVTALVLIKIDGNYGDC